VSKGGGITERVVCGSLLCFNDEWTARMYRQQHLWFTAFYYLIP